MSRADLASHEASSRLLNKGGTFPLTPESGDVSRRKPEIALVTILIVILVLALLGVIPAWPHSNKWGYGPSGGVGLVLLILVILLVMGRI
jgi:hypothetical protein